MRRGTNQNLEYSLLSYCVERNLEVWTDIGMLILGEARGVRGQIYGRSYNRCGGYLGQTLGMLILKGYGALGRDWGC